MSTTKSLRELATENRVPIRQCKGDGSDSGCERVAGKNGHLCQEGSKILLVFCDENRKKPFNGRSRAKADRMMKGYIRELRQDGDYEFIAEIDPDAFPVALDLLGVTRYRKDWGISRPFQR
jgi:hypothetical protein